MNGAATPPPPPGALAAAVSALPEEAREALRLIAFEGGPAGITAELCHQRLNQLTGRRRRNADAILAPLFAARLVVRRRENYREVYALAPEVGDALRDILAEQLSASLLVPGPVDDARQAGTELVWDAHRLLSFVRLEPLRLTQVGSLHRRQRAELLERLVCPHLPPLRIAPREDDEDPAEDVLGLLVGFAVSARLAVRATACLRLGVDVEEWLERDDAAKVAEMWAYHRERHLSGHQDLGMALAALRRTDPGRDAWIDLAALGELVAARRAGPGRGPAHARLERFLLRFLSLSGMLAHGRRGGRVVARLTPLGRAILDEEPLPAGEPRNPAALWVQPSFEVLVPPETPPRLWWDLDRMADLEQTGAVMRYRLSRESVYQALAAGWDAERIGRFLAAHSRTGVPQNVAYTIREWAGRFGQTAFVATVLLHCESAELADAIAASPRLAPYLAGRVGPRALAVREGAEPALRRALLEEGHLPAPGIRQGLE